MAKPLAFFCEVPRYEELCDMFDGKVIDFAEGGPIGQAGTVRRGRIEIVEDHSVEPRHDGVWITIEIHPPETHGLSDSPQGGITIAEAEIELLLRAPEDSEVDWIWNRAKTSGVSEADA